MTTKTLKIVLEGTAKEAVERMIKELIEEREFIRISPIKLVAWIVKHFENKDFNKLKNKIASDHLNSKDYLKSLAENLDKGEGLEEALKKALAQVKAEKGTGTKRTTDKNKETL